MKKNSMLVLQLFLFFLLLSGCAKDATEVDDQVYSLVIGVDRGTESSVRLTIQFPTYEGGSQANSNIGDSSTKDGENKDKNQVGNTLVTTIEAPSVLEGINLLNTSTSRRISLVHTKALILSEDLARDGIGNYIEPIARYREGRRITDVIVCRGKAENFIKENKATIGGNVAKAMELMDLQSDNTGFFPRSQFHEFYSGMLSTYMQPYCMYAGINNYKHMHEGEEADAKSLDMVNKHLPGTLPRRGDKKIEMLGTAIFDGDRMVGVLNAYETRYLLLIKGDFEKGFFTLPDETIKDAALIFDVRLGRKPKIKAHFEEGKAIIELKLIMEADLVAVQSRKPFETEEEINQANKQLKDFIKKGVEKTIEKTQKKYGTDIFGFGKKVARNFFTIDEFESYNWLKNYSSAKINTNVEVNIRRTGLILGASPIRYKEKEKVKK